MAGPGGPGGRGQGGGQLGNLRTPRGVRPSALLKSVPIEVETVNRDRGCPRKLTTSC